MKIFDIVKEKQPDTAIKINELSSQKIRKKDILDCMRHDAYKRGRGGAIRQIRR